MKKLFSCGGHGGFTEWQIVQGCTPTISNKVTGNIILAAPNKLNRTYISTNIPIQLLVTEIVKLESDLVCKS